jgi:hypothetical protein
MTDLDKWIAIMDARGIAYELHRNPTRLEASRTVAFFDDADRFTHWVAKDEPLMMVRDK